MKKIEFGFVQGRMISSPSKKLYNISQKKILKFYGLIITKKI